MISHSYIFKNLKYLDRKYQKSSSLTEASYCSKLAILELCGWIELSMDDIILRACIRGVRDPGFRKAINDKVKRNYGFEYERHFQSMVTALIGYRGYEKIEKKVPTSVSVNLKSELSILKERRNSLAHTYFKGVTPHYDAPSLTVQRYNTVSNGLSAYDQALREYC